ncbi:MAG: hypothetical protein LAO76_17960 [Acidobacteriia bacterium]|nr:hypothetical protein [Terriglobia bacterium]
MIIVLFFWLNWRYAFHALALGWAAGGFAMFWFYIPHPHTVTAWTLRCTLPLVCMRMVYRELELGIPYAKARGRGWETERSQVHEWFKLLMDQNSSSSTVEVSSRGFWSLSTYRLILLGDCWAIAKFTTGDHILLGFRVFARSAVCAAQGLDGKLALYFGSEKIRQASLTPEMLHRLLQLAEPADSVPQL